MQRTGIPIGVDAGVAVTDTLATCAAIPFESCVGGMYQVPVGSSVTSLTWHVQVRDGGSFIPAYDEDGAAVVQTVVHTRAYPIPSALYGAKALKAVAGGANGVIHVLTKS